MILAFLPPHRVDPVARRIQRLEDFVIPALDVLRIETGTRGERAT